MMIVDSAPNRTSWGRVLFCLAFWVFGLATSRDSFPVLLTLPVFVLATFQASRITAPEFTKEDMFWFGVLVFFVVGPCQAIENGVFGTVAAVSRVTYTDEELIRAAALVFLSLVVFSLSSEFFRRRGNVRLAARSFVQQGPLPTWLVCVTYLLAKAALAGNIVFSGGIHNVLAARSDKAGSGLGFVAVGCMAMQFMATFVLAVNARRCLDSRSRDWLAYLALLSALAMLAISVNPFNISRFVFVATWVPVALGLLGRWARYYVVYALLLAGVLIAMPVMSITTRGGAAAWGGFSDSNYARDFFVMKDIDVFDTLTHTIKYQEMHGWMYGDNTIAILLFFVPRAFWASKPIVGGLIIGGDLYENYGAGTPNLSYYIGGDFFLDFGMIGVVVGFGVLGWLWRYSERLKLNIQGVDALALLIIGSVPILLRGPVGAIIGYFFCQVVALGLFKLLLSLVSSEPKRRLLLNR